MPPPHCSSTTSSALPLLFRKQRRAERVSTKGEVATGIPRKLMETVAGTLEVLTCICASRG
jgi:hypothetical protein